jgi:hypothetical protein
MEIVIQVCQSDGTTNIIETDGENLEIQVTPVLHEMSQPDSKIKSVYIYRDPA